MSDRDVEQSRIEAQVVSLMRRTNDPEVLRTITDPRLVKVCTSWVRSSLKVYESLSKGGKSSGGIKLVAAATSLVSSGSSTVAYATKSNATQKSGFDTGKLATGAGFVAGQFGSSMSLVKLASVTSPTSAAVTIGFTFADKMLQTTSLVADSDKAKCYNALAKTAINGGFMLFTATSGIGLVSFGIAMAASAYESGYYCQRHWAE
jgi:hypothetical protein